ncbi:MAG: M20 family metallopeptidase [Blautia sp.]|jgi:acetylornithine deacetylase/succinyl-diaminopimelate desuccinylase family protein
MDVSKLLEQIDRQELTAFLQRAVQIPSHIETKDEEKEIALFLAERLKREGIETDLQIVEKERPNVIAVIHGTGEGKSVTFNGHMDSIPPFDMEDPYSGKIVGDDLYGRGSCDMKAGIIAMAYAMIAIKRSGLIPKGDIVLSAVVGEEYGSCGAKHYVKNNKLTDYGICGEPTDMKIGSAQKGLHWFEFHIPGKTIHSSVSSKGINAIKRLNELMNDITQDLEPKLAARTHPLLGSSLVNLGKVWGGEQPNIVPGEAFLQIERRYIPGETRASVEAELDEIVEKCNAGYDAEYAITYESMPYSLNTSKTPMDIPAGHPIVQGMKEAGRTALGQDLDIIGVPYWGDAGVLYDAGVDCILFGPGSVNDGHSKTEKVNLTNVYNAAKVYAVLPFVLAGEKG